MSRRRWRSRRPRKGSRRRLVWFVLLVFLLSFVQSFIFIEKNLKPPLMNLAKIRLKQMATQSINKAIADRIAEETNFDKLIDWRTDKDGKVTGFMLNYTEHMRITSDTINRVQNLLLGLKRMPEHIPLGMAMNSAIFASFGPDIPIRLTPAGAVKVDLNTRYQNAGINMILVEVYIRIMAEVTIIIPFDTEPEIVETELPISYLLVVGDTPMYYYDNKGNPVGNSSPLPPGVTLPGLSSGSGASSGATNSSTSIPAASGAGTLGGASTTQTGNSGSAGGTGAAGNGGSTGSGGNSAGSGSVGP
ncbi:sporulation protein YunB [Gorillibacterium timonense]|uniref:sporulation protein YunB n=1 Tax=Gorillibacterium timonense TaxID=1689269 RepID=UPI0009E6ABE9|nr:sporulation protein YunB [Gorillibacterium timonense]